MYTTKEAEINDDTLPRLLIGNDDPFVGVAYETAERAIRGDAFVSTFIDQLSAPEVRTEVVAYMAECLMAVRPVTPTYAIKYLGHWDEFKASIFKLVALEEAVLLESEGEGVTLSEDDRRLLRRAAA